MRFRRLAQERRLVPAVTALEDRIALSGVSSYDPATGQLTVSGDDTANRIAVTAILKPNTTIGKITVVIDGQTTTYDAPLLTGIAVSGNGGDDLIGVSFRGFRPSTIRVEGNAGNDTIGVAGGGAFLDYVGGAPTTTLDMLVTGDGPTGSGTPGNDNIGVALSGLNLTASRLVVQGETGDDRLSLALSAVSLGSATKVSALGGDGADAVAVALNDDRASGASTVLVDGGASADALAFTIGGLGISGTGLEARVDGNGAGGTEADTIGVAVVNVGIDVNSSLRLGIDGRGGDDIVSYSQIGLSLARGASASVGIRGGDGNDKVTAAILLTTGSGVATVDLDGGAGVDSLVLVAPRPRRGGPLILRVTGFESRIGS